MCPGPAIFSYGQGKIFPKIKKEDMIMSSGKTTNLGLHQWEKEDLFLMDEFNEDNQLLDAAVGKSALLKLETVTLTAAANKVAFDLSGYDLSSYSELRLHIDGTCGSTGRRILYLSLNETAATGMYYYLSAAAAETSFTLSDEAGIPLGRLTSAGNYLQSGLDATIHLYGNGLYVEGRGVSLYSESALSYDHFVGMPSMDNGVTRDTLKSVEVYFTDSSVMLTAGSKVTLYGVAV